MRRAFGQMTLITGKDAAAPAAATAGAASAGTASAGAACAGAAPDVSGSASGCQQRQRWEPNTSAKAEALVLIVPLIYSIPFISFLSVCFSFLLFLAYRCPDIGCPDITPQRPRGPWIRGPAHR